MDIITVSWISILMAVVFLLIIAADLFRHRQKMWIMNLVWPLTALYAGPLALLAYFKIGRMIVHPDKKARLIKAGDNDSKPFWQSVLKGTLHCGSGCTLGDLIAANLLIVFPVTVFGSRLYGEWTIDFLAAFLIGIIFQYYAIKPMGNLSAKQAIVAALKADTLSLTCWQIGMYGWMAIADFLIFGHVLKATVPAFWLMMQIGMLFGLLTAYPMNWWLIRKGIKEVM